MLLRYLLVGVAATAVHWLLLVAWVQGAGWPAWTGSALGAVVGAQVAFFGNRRFTFGHRGALAPAWWRFMGTALLGAALNAAIVGGGVALGWHYLMAQACATAAAFGMTFVVNRHWSFAP